MLGRCLPEYFVSVATGLFAFLFQRFHAVPKYAFESFVSSR